MRDSTEYQPPTDADRSIADARAIAHCEFCDDAGMRGMHRCDHQTDYAALADKWRPRIREILTKKGKR